MPSFGRKVYVLHFCPAGTPVARIKMALTMDGPENQRLGREVGGRLRSSCSLQRPWCLQGLQSAQSGFDSATLLSAASGVAWTDRALLQPLVSALVRLSLLTAAALTSALEERPCSAHVGCGSGLPHSRWPQHVCWAPKRARGSMRAW